MILRNRYFLVLVALFVGAFVGFKLTETFAIKYIMENLPINGTTGRTNDNPQHMFDSVSLITRDEINSNVKEYLSLLDMRAAKDALANRKYSQLKQEYKDAVDNFEKRKNV